MKHETQSAQVPGSRYFPWELGIPRSGCSPPRRQRVHGPWGGARWHGSTNPDSSGVQHTTATGFGSAGAGRRKGRRRPGRRAARWRSVCVCVSVCVCMCVHTRTRAHPERGMSVWGRQGECASNPEPAIPIETRLAGLSSSGPEAPCPGLAAQAEGSPKVRKALLGIRPASRKESGGTPGTQGQARPSPHPHPEGGRLAPPPETTDSRR